MKRKLPQQAAASGFRGTTASRALAVNTWCPSQAPGKVPSHSVGEEGAGFCGAHLPLCWWADSEAACSHGERPIRTHPVDAADFASWNRNSEASVMNQFLSDSPVWVEGVHSELFFVDFALLGFVQNEND